MSLLNPVILYGLVLAGLPVLLHLLLRQKPKKLLFPALRLIQQRRTQNVRRFRLRHLWLLLLRILAIAVIVLAIARPSLPAADYSFKLREWLTLGAIILVGVVAYFLLLSRWRASRLPSAVFQFRRSAARGWATGGTLLALLLAVGCPYQQRIAAEIKAPAPAADIDLPVAAVFLFDTSLSMGYQQEGQTRLELAREVATKHLSELPAGSRVAVVDTARTDPVIFQPTLSAAQSRIQSLTPHAVSTMLNERLRACLLRQEDDRRQTLEEQGQVAEDARRDRFLRRVYVFTDLTKSNWQAGGSSLLKRELERLDGIHVFLVDVGVMQPTNLAVTQIRLSRQQVPTGGQLAVSALLSAAGDPREVRVELHRARGADGSVTQGHQQVKLEPGTSQWVSFPLFQDLTGPVLHGEVRLVSSDPLAMDDVRRFTVQVGDPARVLVVAPRRETAREWLLLLNPDPDLLKFRLQFEPVTRLRDIDLMAYDVVYFLNVPQLSDTEWERVGRFLEQGGGAAFVLGSEGVQPHSYNRAQAQVFLPVRVDVARRRPDRHLRVEKPEHPIFRKLSEIGGLPLLQNDVFIDRMFLVEPAAGAGVVARFTDEDESPALIERVHGRGRCVVLATAVDGAQGPLSRWNNLTDPTLASWPVIAFAESLTLYLARSTESRFNVTAGENVTLLFEPSDTERAFLLKRPEFRQTRVTLPAGEGELSIADANDIGRYDLLDAGMATQPVAGFSVNPAAPESDLSRLTPEELDGLLGEKRYQVARTIEELDASVSITDLGREVFPILLLLTIVAFLGEHLVANRFYETDDDTTSVPATVA